MCGPPTLRVSGIGALRPVHGCAYATENPLKSRRFRPLRHAAIRARQQGEKPAFIALTP